MIDTHCHILPGIDDGARTMDEAVEMARMAAADGVKVIVATPHWDAVSRPLDMDFLAERVAELQARIEAEGIELRIEPGAEVMLSPDLVERAEAGDLPRLAGSEYVLVEAPAYVTWDVMRRTLFELQLRGVRLVLAHPERAGPVLEDYSRAAELSSGGIKLQVTATDLARPWTSLGWSNSVIRVARALIRDGLADLLASDAHGVKGAPPGLTRVRRLVERLGGRGTFERLTVSGPMAILNSRA